MNSNNKLGKSDNDILQMNDDFSIKIESNTGGNSDSNFVSGEKLNMETIGNNSNNNSWQNSKELVYFILIFYF